ncbi:MAG TPA: co-chaperone GroES [Candidatus Rubrimentiphilum sp.]|nr:co-chaperone GroES [Candidatus Rubrimentiphilum sp.]
MNLKPLGDRVVIEIVEQQEKTAGGVYLPDTAKEKSQEGVVRAVGEYFRIFDSTGTTMPQKLKVGDRVLFAKYSGSEYKSEGKEYVVVTGKDILGIVEKVPAGV